MPSFSTRLLLAVLLAIGIQKALAIPTAIPDESDIPAVVKRLTPKPGDDQQHPIIKDFDASESDDDYPGLQELFDSDCFAHLCEGMPVLTNRWDQQKKARSPTTGNGAKREPGIFTDKGLKKYATKRPESTKDGKGKDVVYNSPEEWPPASSSDGGLLAVLFPVSKQAQDRQKVLLKNKFYDTKPVIGTQKGADGSMKGNWFRFKSFDGAKGPYCKKLNDLLSSYSDNFSSQGVLNSDKKPDICTAKDIELNGLKYDVGMYAYQINPEDTAQYFNVGKGMGS